jgi:acetyl esterase/lipase
MSSRTKFIMVAPNLKLFLFSAIALGGLLWSLFGTRGVRPKFGHMEDVIYGRKDGLALTLDVFSPDNRNGAAIISVISAGFRSNHAAIDMEPYKVLLKRGYTVFAVVHGSQPKYTIQEIPNDIHRAVRFVRSYAHSFQIDPQRIGIMGASAGGHLALLLATTGCYGDPKQEDPVDRQSSEVQAAACYFPITDFLNYGEPGEVELGQGRLAGFRAAFDFHRIDAPTGTYQLIRDEATRQAIGRRLSPAYFVSAATAPCFIIHGDTDDLVPAQQSMLFAERMKDAGAPVKLVIKPGAGHGWPGYYRDMPILADWFDRCLLSTKRLCAGDF